MLGFSNSNMQCYATQHLDWLGLCKSRHLVIKSLMNVISLNCVFIIDHVCNMHTIQSALTNAMQCPICVPSNIYIGRICIISVFSHNQHITLLIEFNLYIHTYVTCNKVSHLLSILGWHLKMLSANLILIERPPASKILPFFLTDRRSYCKIDTGSQMLLASKIDTSWDTELYSGGV